MQSRIFDVFRTEEEFLRALEAAVLGFAFERTDNPDGSVDLRAPGHSAVTHWPRRRSRPFQGARYADGYEAATTATISFLLRTFNVKTMFDIGASRGFFALLAASTEAREVTAHAFEMSPAQHRAACNDYAARPEFRGRLHAHLAGLSDRHEGEREIWFSRTRMFEYEPQPAEYREAWWRRLKFYLRGVRNRDALQKALVTLTSIDYLSQSAPPDLLKIDVDGHEALVLKGGATTFKERRPFVLLELHSDELLARFGVTRREVVAPMFASGYKAAAIRNHTGRGAGVEEAAPDSPVFALQKTSMLLFY